MNALQIIYAVSQTAGHLYKTGLVLFGDLHVGLLQIAIAPVLQLAFQQLDLFAFLLVQTLKLVVCQSQIL